LVDFDLCMTTVGIPPKLSTRYEKMTTIKPLQWSEQND
jgi:hypothetical protein